LHRRFALESFVPFLLLMGYRTLRQCVDDLAATKQLVRLEVEIDPHLEAAEIQRRVYQAGGPAIYFARLKGCRFPAVSNLFGTIERTRYLFRDTLAAVQRLIALKTDPARHMARPWKYLSAVPAALHMLPKRVRTGPVLAHQTTIDQLPQIVSWPDDGGPFVTLPQVYTEHPERPGWQRSNLGMYRIQLGGNQYAANREIGLHYQIHRGIGVHHTAAKRRGEALRAAVFVGGPPAMTVSAVMPLPETVPELSFARRARRASRSDDRANIRSLALCRGRLHHHRHDRPESDVARRSLRRPPRLLREGPRLSRLARRRGVSPHRSDLAVYGRRSPAARTPASARLSTSLPDRSSRP
jgi:hypothetical protein